jgi:hypothetical protein
MVNAAKKGNTAGEYAYQLVGDEKDGLEGEVFVAHLEQVLERGSKKVKDHDIEVPMLSRPHYPGYTGRARESLVYL